MPSLALAIITRNEGPHLGAFLSRMADLVDEIVIVDTGSTDNTHDALMPLLRVLPIRIVFSTRTWDDDFAAARNASLEQVASDWIFVMDPDEYLDPVDFQLIHRSIGSVGVWKVDGYRMTTLNFTDIPDLHNAKDVRFIDEHRAPSSVALERRYGAGHNLSHYFESHKTRLFRNNPRYRFEGRIHELIDMSIAKAGGRIADMHEPRILHTVTRAEQEAKEPMYRRIAMIQAGEEPDNAFAQYYAGLANVDCDPPTAEQYFRVALRIKPTHFRALYNYGILLKKARRWVEAFAMFKRALDVKPGDRATKHNAGLAWDEMKGVGM